jgi:hypothetical protein
MLNFQQVWSIVSQYPDFRDNKLTDFGYQVLPLKIAGITSLNTISNQQMVFPGGAIICGWTAGAQPNGQAATQTYRPGLDLFAAQVEYQQNRKVMGSTRGIGSALFGDGRQDVVPFFPLVIPTQGALVYEVENLTLTTIDVWFGHHCLVPIAVG